MVSVALRAQRREDVEFAAPISRGDARQHGAHLVSTAVRRRNHPSEATEASMRRSPLESFQPGARARAMATSAAPAPAVRWSGPRQQQCRAAIPPDPSAAWYLTKAQLGAAGPQS